MNTIPPIPHEWRGSWRQPKVEDIVVYDEIARMSFKDYNELHEYSGTYPTGVYIGKMFKRKGLDGMMLVWYSYDREGDMNRLSINYRDIEITDKDVMKMGNGFIRIHQGNY